MPQATKAILVHCPLGPGV